MTGRDTLDCLIEWLEHLGKVKGPIDKQKELANVERIFKEKVK